MDAPGPVIVVPARGVVLLVGASGSGKTTFALRHFKPTEVLSSDAFRALVGDDEADMTATPAAFDVLTRVLAHRLRRGRLSVVDATNIKPGDRRTVLTLAARARRPAVAIVLDLPEELCQARNAERPGRVVDPAVVRQHIGGMRRSLADPERFLGEGFAAVHVLRDAAAVEAASVTRDPALPRPASVVEMPRAGAAAATRDGGQSGAGTAAGVNPPSAPRGRTA